ncbi:uncharacterized protein YALI1_D33397g [Yarrowia lipolytica]|uniref:Uncharacterized protein n=1 Tax=Yarrowia lipolytica TaxID=4952 RepID=A0A1D8NG58_YARLL|nr:hypothetical protein YALI1_D33397g [Yarrowia lipolytica]
MVARLKCGKLVTNFSEASKLRLRSWSRTTQSLLLSLLMCSVFYDLSIITTQFIYKSITRTRPPWQATPCDWNQSRDLIETMHMISQLPPKCTQIHHAPSLDPTSSSRQRHIMCT